jgi:tetratricopeptide (TPR) repeat protein
MARLAALAADGELNRVYGVVKPKLPAARGAALRDEQREWVHFAYGELPSPDASAETWTHRRDLAADRIRYLERFAKEAETAPAQALQAQLEAAEKAEDWPAVAEIARRLLAGDAKNAAWWEKRVRALDAAKDVPQGKQALQEWAQAVAQPPAVIDDLRGDLADDEDDNAGAIRFWTAYAAVAKKDADVRGKLADIFADEENWKACAAAREEQMKLDPTPEGWTELARAYAQLHDWKRMTAVARKANALDATNEEIKKLWPRVEQLEKELPGIQALERTLAAPNTGPGPLLEQAQMFLRAEWPELALPNVEKTLKMQPDSRLGTLLKGFALAKLDRGEEASDLGVDTSRKSLANQNALEWLAEGDKAMALHPGVGALVQRAEGLNGCEQFKLAEAEARAALKLDPRNAGALMAQGVALSRMSRTWEGLAKLRQASELAPKDASAWLELGQIEAELDRHEAALTALGRALKIDPKNARALQAREESLHALQPK